MKLETKVKLISLGTAAVGAGLAAAGMVEASDSQLVNEVLLVSGGAAMGNALGWMCLSKIFNYISKPKEPSRILLYDYSKNKFDYRD